MKRRILLAGLASVPALALLGCTDKEKVSANGYKEIKLGTLSGPHGEIADIAVKIAEKNGLKVKVVEFSDYGHLNEALSTGDIDCNAFQHKPYLDKACQTHGYQFTALGKTVIFPIGVYSYKVKRKEDITDGMLVSVPADPVNLGRGLQLLERNGLIKLREGVGIHAALTDIVDNPKHLKFREVDSAYLGRSLPDVGFAIINGSWAVKSNLTPSKDAFILEGADSDFANVLVVQTKDKDRPEFKVLLKAYQSPEVKKFVTDKYRGSVVAAF